ncbi:MAG: carotenoid biosynthesis protein [Winogradskyella sp.]|uniref:carotenoid biosynthesis protein n=1 Tax=Winogradskyella sp. TaxID=1883156 RepID=UPI0017D48989|nr:carotenoid biosynthesis protein [Winogradskyella sp.]MBT8243928.1 carotenoid biosynthesis protein [Winogradskyella sp.]NNK23211.1 carotenoid biosynthesis protein [Winogradskyella sp.]
MFDKKFKFYFSIFLIWLFSVSGVFGILSPEHSEWFLSMTPLNLLLTFVILVINIEALTPKIIIALSIPFFIGFITEALGVNYGLIFGSYAYGENLGFKVFGVPLMICVNWALLTAVTADVAKCFGKNIWVSAFIGGALMTLLDLLIEVSAPRFDFWEFEGGIVPLQNYIGWLVTAFIAHLGYQYFNIKTNKSISWHILISIALFFAVFLFF